MAQQQCVFAVVGGVTEPPLPAGLAHQGAVAAVKDDALITTPAGLHGSDGDVSQWWRFREEPRRVVQPTPSAIERQCRFHLDVDPLELVHIADRSASTQPGKDELVAKGVRGEGD